MFGAKTEIAALEKGLDFELVMVPFEEKYEPKHPEVLRINPKQQVPILDPWRPGNFQLHANLRVLRGLAAPTATMAAGTSSEGSGALA